MPNEQGLNYNKLDPYSSYLVDLWLRINLDHSTSQPLDNYLNSNEHNPENGTLLLLLQCREVPLIEKI